MDDAFVIHATTSSPSLIFMHYRGGLMLQIDEALLDEIAQGEVDAIREGLADPEMRRDPKFLDRVRKFLKDNNFLVSAKTDGLADVKRQIERQHIPVFDDVTEGIDIDQLN